MSQRSKRCHQYSKKYNVTYRCFFLSSVEVDDVQETSENEAVSSVQPPAALLSDPPAVSRQTEGSDVLLFEWMKKFAKSVQGVGACKAVKEPTVQTTKKMFKQNCTALFFSLESLLRKLNTVSWLQRYINQPLRNSC